MDIERELLELIKIVAGMKAQYGTMLKVFIGIAIVVGANLVLNINAHVKNGKKK